LFLKCQVRTELADTEDELGSEEAVLQHSTTSTVLNYVDWFIIFTPIWHYRTQPMHYSVSSLNCSLKLIFYHYVLVYYWL